MRVLFQHALRIFLLFVLLAVVQAQDSTRVLLRPPEKIPTTLIDGKKYVKGEVYLSKTANPEILKPLGFRDASFFVSASRYHRYKAIWPLDLNLDKLPKEIVGLNYDYKAGTSSQEIGGETYETRTGAAPPNDIIWSGKNGPQIDATSTGYTVRNHDGGPFNRFGQAFPAQPDTIILGEPYVKGEIFLNNLKDADILSKLGFTKLIDLGLNHDTGDEMDRAITKYYEKHPELKVLQILIYETCWPMNLDVSKLPGSVNTIISYQVGMKAYQVPHRPKRKTSLEALEK
jgi:hypothetical protein